MSANLDETLGFVALAFAGPRSKIWHGTGQSIDQKAAELGRPLTLEETWALAGCNFDVDKVPLVVNLTGADFDHIEPSKRMFAYPDRFAHVRRDTGAPVGMASGQYQLVQPSTIRDTFARYLEADDRFQITTVGALDGGKRIWAQAQFDGTQDVAGDKHKRHLLMSTTFDTTSCTRLQGSVTRVVCENTIRVAMGEEAPIVNVRHTTRFDIDKARKELATIASGFDAYKAMGDALARRKLASEELATFLRDVLDIPRDAQPDDVSTRKKNQRQAIIDAMLVSANERGGQRVGDLDAFTALQGVTRYVDHTRDANDTENRLFGSGAALKDKALGLLLPFIGDKVLVNA
jgi:phage/plasmid-like protein (TIGR03299 family)